MAVKFALDQDYAAWKKRADQQMKALREVACQEYLDCLDVLYPILSPDQPPRFWT